VRSVSAVSTSSAEKGSSSSSSIGSTTIARARPTRCRIPPDNSRGSAFSKPSRPMRSIAARARWRRSAGAIRRASSPSSTFWSTVSQGNSAKLWNTMATGVESPCTSSSTWPSSGWISPAIARSSVDLPEPDLPSRPTISPSRSVSSTSFNTGLARRAAP
jgi:hypothetical protein